VSFSTAHEAQAAGDVASPEKARMRRPLEQLLHGLNQPLTGLQCSMEVALASPRTVEYYVERLRQGLELTERMRALVAAIREVVDGEEEKDEENEAEQTVDLKLVLEEAIDELEPVAQAKKVCLAFDFAASALAVSAGRRRLSAVVFRFLESALSLADGGSALHLDAGADSGGGADGAWIRLQWQAGSPRSEFSRAELGLLVAQAGWERAGAQWERARTGNLETVRVRLLGVLGGRNF
jgi:signal transduction histidine kinase